MMLALANCRCIGAMLPATGKSTFDEADLIVSDGSSIVRVQAYVNGSIEGSLLSPEEWSAFQADGQAVAIEDAPCPIESGTKLWALRANFEKRDSALRELATSGALSSAISESSLESTAAKLCFVVSPRAQQLRETWAARALEEADATARAGVWAAAVNLAEQAFALQTDLDPRALALLIVAYERTGRERRAEGYLRIAANSRGAEFAERVQAFRQRLSSDLGGGTTSSLGVERRSPAVARSPWQADKKRHLTSGLQHLNSERAA